MGSSVRGARVQSAGLPNRAGLTRNRREPAAGPARNAHDIQDEDGRGTRLTRGRRFRDETDEDPQFPEVAA